MNAVTAGRDDQRGYVRAATPRRPGQPDHTQRRRLERKGKKERPGIRHRHIVISNAQLVNSRSGWVVRASDTAARDR